MVKVIGLTGGIGSGKSTVSHFLAELGAIILDADKLGHEVFKPGTDAWHDVVAEFGEQVVSPSGEIDRKKLGEIVFGNDEALVKLNQIMHPRIFDAVKSRIDEYRQQGVGVVVLEAALLIEADWTSLVDEVWVVLTSEEVVLDRLKKQRGLAKKQTLARIRSQLPAKERAEHADTIINNDGNLDEMKAKLRELWEKLHS